MEHISTNSAKQSSISILVSSTNGSEPASRLSILEQNNKRWDKYKDEIKRLYVDQDKSLKETMELMESTRGLKASLRKWKMKLKDWGFNKNIPAREMTFMIEKAKKRRREGKNTEFMRAGQKVPRDRLESFQKRKTNDIVDVEPYHAYTPPDISYHTPNIAECDIELPDSIDDAPSPRNSPEETTGIELDVSLPSIDPSKLRLHPTDTHQSNLARLAQEETIDDIPWAFEEWNIDNDQYWRTHTKIFIDDSLDQARQYKLSLQTEEAIRYFLRALFVASLAMNEHLSDGAWTECLDELSNLLISTNASGLQIHTLFREAFELTERNTWSNHKPVEKRLELIWKGFLRLSTGLWTRNSQTVCEILVNSFPASGMEIDRWRCRLELVKALLHRNLHQKAHEHQALAFSECLRQRKAVPGKDFTSVWPELFSGCTSNPSFAYHIMSTALQCLTTGWWTIGQELLGGMKAELKTIYYGRIPQKWVILFIKLFESCYGHSHSKEYLPRAELHISQAAKITEEFFLQAGRCYMKKNMLNSEWKRCWIKISNPYYHKSKLTIPTIEKIKDINTRLGNVDGQGWRLLVNPGDIARCGANRDYAQDNNSDNGKSDFSDWESRGYGVTYTESLSSCPSMNYSALFPPEHRNLSV